MSASDLGAADFAPLLELAESRFSRWHQRELRPERNQRLRELNRQCATVGTAGKNIHLLRLERELLEKACLRRIAFYFEVAQERQRQEMLSGHFLAKLRQRIETSVGTSLTALRGRIQRAAHAVGLADSAVPHEGRYTQLRSELLDVVDAELRVIAAERNLAGRASAPVKELIAAQSDDPVPTTDAPAPVETPPSTAEEQDATDSAAETASDPDPIKAQRTALFATFKKKADSQGIRITDPKVAKAIKPGKWTDRTMIGWWKRNDPRCKPPHDKLIRAFLNKDPSEILPSK